MTPSKKAALTAGLLLLSAAAVETACARAGAPKGPQQQTRQQPLPAREDAPEGWQRYQLEGGDGDEVGALLPGKPQDFGVANLRRQSGGPLTARVHMLSADAKVYFAVFVDLPRPAAEMSAHERSDVFHGTWMALALKTGQVLEEKFGAPFRVTESDEKVGEAPPGGERHMQDFKVGTQQGRAQAIFTGRRAYMVAAVWDERPDSERDATRFLNSFQVKLGRPQAGVE